MAKDNLLASSFVTELFAASIERRTIFDIVLKYMNFSFLQVEAEKKVWQYLSNRYNKTGRIPSIGQLQQNFVDDDEVLDLLFDIADIEIDDNYDYDALIEAFETFIKKMKFLEANDIIADTYNKGQKDKAWDLFVKYAEDFSSFTIKDAKFEAVFADFEQRQLNRQSEDWNLRYKVPTTIEELDERLGGYNGGPETGECVLWLGDSGSGKSQALVHMGIAAARQGFKVAHFQLEGTKQQCLNRYDAAWTGTLYNDMKVGDVPAKKIEIARKVLKKFKTNDILVSSEETFNAKTLSDIRRELQEMVKVMGDIDVIIIDYLELLEVGDGHNYSPSEERFRQAKLAKGMKMLAMEFNAVVHTATQSNNIKEIDRNNPNFVITRENLSEDKGKIRPFDIFVTINQTRDEMKAEIMRLHTDKLRDYKSGDPIRICNNFAYSRFYDRKRTMNMDWEAYDEEVDTKRSKEREEA